MGYPLPEWSYTSQLSVYCIYFLLRLCIDNVIHPSQDTTSSYTHTNQNTSSKTVLLEIMAFFLNIDGICAYCFCFLPQLNCTITEYRYSPPPPIIAAVKSTWQGYLTWNDSSDAYTTYCTASSFLLLIMSEAFLKATLQKSYYSQQYHYAGQRHNPYCARQRFPC